MMTRLKEERLSRNWTRAKVEELTGAELPSRPPFDGKRGFHFMASSQLLL